MDDSAEPRPDGTASTPAAQPSQPAPPSGPRLAWRYAALSDVGRVRKDNQDSGYAGPHLLVVADGVGGAARGDLASSTAVSAMSRLDTERSGDMLEALAGAIHRAHDKIAELVEQDPELEGTSTTVTSVVFDGTRIAVGHIGDSRGYLLRDGVLSQLTRDHTFVQTLVDEGRITEEESRTHPHRNLILRAVDGVRETDPDLFHVDVAPGDRILLCSDGASGVLDAGRLADILGTGSVDYAAVELVRASLEAGSTDNVTCVVADIVDAAELDASGAAAADEERAGAMAATGPMTVGAAAELARRGSGPGRGLFRGHRSGDTGEIEPVPGDPAASRGPATGEDDDDPEQLRYAPRAPRGGKWARRLAVLLVVALVLGGGSWLAWRWSQGQYFVAEHDERVAIFRGVQVEIPWVATNEVVETTEVTVAALPDFSRDRLADGIRKSSLADARATVEDLTETARVCPAPTPTPSPSPRRTPSPGATRSPGASPAPSPSASPSASATPSPSPTLAPPDCIEATP